MTQEVVSFFTSAPMSSFLVLQVQYLQYCLSLQLVVQLNCAPPPPCLVLLTSPPSPQAPSSLFIFHILWKPAFQPPHLLWASPDRFPLADQKGFISLSLWFHKCSWVFLLIYWKHSKSTMLPIKTRCYTSLQPAALSKVKALSLQGGIEGCCSPHSPHSCHLSIHLSSFC